MNTRLRNLLLSLVLAISLALSSTPLPAQAASLYVDDSPANNGTVLCPATPYTTIQSAVDVAVPWSVITVCPGTYITNVLISGTTKNNIRLVAKGAVSIRPAAIDTAVITVVGATGVTVRGFRIDGHGLYGATGNPIGIFYINSSGTILKNVITGMARSPVDATDYGIGIALANLSATPLPVKVQKNTIHGYQYAGILSLWNAVPNITQNMLVSGGDAGNSPVGIWVSSAPGGKVVKNTVMHDWSAMHPVNSTGILVQNSTLVRVLNNKVHETKNGIELYGQGGLAATANTVKNNKIRNSWNTLWLYADGGNVTNNMIVANRLYDYNTAVGQYGIYLQLGSGSIVGNQILSNKIYGFYGVGIMGTTAGNLFLGNQVDLPLPGGLDVAPSTTPFDPATRPTPPEQPLPQLPELPLP